MELDIWIEELSLAFEYQGEQHYHKNIEEAFGVEGKSRLYVRRDEAKERSCKKIGIFLVLVPYWWDKGSDSLKALIKEAREE